MTSLIKTFLILIMFISSVWAKDPCQPSRLNFITDSHGVGPFGHNMDQWFLNWEGFELHTYALGGSSPFWFLRGDNGFTTTGAFLFNSCEGKPYPTVSERRAITATSKDIKEMMALNPAHPFQKDIVVFEQGSNVPGARSVYRTQARDLVLGARRAAPESICFWVSAPRMTRISDSDMREVNQFVIEGLKEASDILAKEYPNNKNPSCYFINSQKYSAYPTNFPGQLDGVHYPFPWGCSDWEREHRLPKCIDHTIPWAQGVRKEIEEILNNL